MLEVAAILEEAQKKGAYALDEYEGKRILAAYGAPVVRESLTYDWMETKAAALKIGYPVVMKVCSRQATHKTEEGLVALNIKSETELQRSFENLYASAQRLKGGILIQQMVEGVRELAAGMIRDPQFGPCVMFGIGGVFAEVIQDVSFWVAPVQTKDVYDMIDEIKGRKILEAARGMEAVDLEAVARCVIALGNIGLEHEIVKEIDVNPLVVRGGRPVAVDALVVLEKRRP